MICPHCQRTISEQQRYLMSRDPDSELVAGWKAMCLVLLFVILVAALSLAHTVS